MATRLTLPRRPRRGGRTIESPVASQEIPHSHPFAFLWAFDFVSLNLPVAAARVYCVPYLT
jgi:hypothetical protein